MSSRPQSRARPHTEELRTRAQSMGSSPSKKGVLRSQHRYPVAIHTAFLPSRTARDLLTRSLSLSSPLTPHLLTETKSVLLAPSAIPLLLGTVFPEVHEPSMHADTPPTHAHALTKAVLKLYMPVGCDTPPSEQPIMGHSTVGAGSPSRKRSGSPTSSPQGVVPRVASVGLTTKNLDPIHHSSQSSHIMTPTRPMDVNVPLALLQEEQGMVEMHPIPLSPSRKKKTMTKRRKKKKKEKEKRNEEESGEELYLRHIRQKMEAERARRQSNRERELYVTQSQPQPTHTPTHIPPHTHPLDRSILQFGEEIGFSVVPASTAPQPREVEPPPSVALAPRLPKVPSHSDLGTTPAPHPTEDRARVQSPPTPLSTPHGLGLGDNGSPILISDPTQGPPIVRIPSVTPDSDMLSMYAQGGRNPRVRPGTAYMDAGLQLQPVVTRAGSPPQTRELPPPPAMTAKATGSAMVPPRSRLSVRPPSLPVECTPSVCLGMHSVAGGFRVGSPTKASGARLLRTQFVPTWTHKKRKSAKPKRFGLGPVDPQTGAILEPQRPRSRCHQLAPLPPLERAPKALLSPAAPSKESPPPQEIPEPSMGDLSLPSPVSELPPSTMTITMTESTPQPEESIHREEEAPPQTPSETDESNPPPPPPSEMPSPLASISAPPTTPALPERPRVPHSPKPKRKPRRPRPQMATVASQTDLPFEDMIEMEEEEEESQTERIPQKPTHNSGRKEDFRVGISALRSLRQSRSGGGGDLNKKEEGEKKEKEREKMRLARPSSSPARRARDRRVRPPSPTPSMPAAVSPTRRLLDVSEAGSSPRSEVLSPTTLPPEEQHLGAWGNE
eukprot:gnl/Trimastix_PCT/2464.p1 GENE.gnl/Trimastix_PCT/2464~~gnl/Trimastix_PCT/2464.p1  ORF type:complete len:837 (+),score=104.20 gnl/Trimastix_PCT/2464:544-3054(+)